MNRLGDCRSDRFLLITKLSCLLALLLVGTWQAQADPIFADNFNAGASPLWGNEIGWWFASAGVYDAASPSTLPNAHSSLPFDLFGFSIEFDINDVSDGGVWLRSAAAPGTGIGRTGVLLVTGGNGGTGTGLYWHIVTDGNSYGPQLNETTGLFVNSVSDPHIRVEVVGDTYSAFVDGALTPATTLTTAAFPSGRVALYDFSGQTFDNVLLAAVAVPEPSSALLLAIGGSLAVSCRKLRRTLWGR